MNDRIEGFIAGVLVCSIVTATVIAVFRGSPSKAPAEAAVPVVTIADDNCNSLYYDSLPAERKDGVGFPVLNSTRLDVVARLKMVHPEYSRLPFALYKEIVENLPVVCVDVMCRRQDGKLLLFYRRDRPAAHIWWWPGGRMFRGETFFDAAVRKVRDETGQKRAVVKPLGVVQVWNTFFPDSHWDAERKAGREGTQTVNIVVVCDMVWNGADDQIPAGEEAIGVNASKNAEWAVEAHRWVSSAEAIAPGAYDKYVSGNVKLALQQGLL